MVLARPLFRYIWYLSFSAPTFRGFADVDGLLSAFICLFMALSVDFSCIVAHVEATRIGIILHVDAPGLILHVPRRYIQVLYCWASGAIL